MPKMCELIFLVVAVITHKAIGKALDSKNCLGLSGRATDCDSDHYCSSSLLDKGCRHCRDIADHYCHNNTKIQADFPSCRDYCQRMQWEKLVAGMNETLKNLSSENSPLSQALTDKTQALHTAQDLNGRLNLALITTSVLSCLLILLLALCLWKNRRDHTRLLQRSQLPFTASETTESAWWMCCVSRRTLGAPITVMEPDAPTAMTTFLNDSSSLDNLRDSGLPSLASADVNLAASRTISDAMNEIC